EALLGGIEGVTKTRTGWLDNREVVELWFDPAQVSYATLVEKAQSMSCADRIYARTDAQARTAKQHAPDRTVRTDDSIRATPDDDKYAMRQTTWARVPMTEAQAVRVNASISEGVNPGDVLSPRQRALHGVISTHPDAPWPMCIGREEITAAWRSTMAAADAAGLR
ncbi:MAG: hypothetical protein VYC34_02555, partial [Planctomycetota bacterium]|nr:hypothetical protein [Planctomycetota bacterium]